MSHPDPTAFTVDRGFQVHDHFLHSLMRYGCPCCQFEDIQFQARLAISTPAHTDLKLDLDRTDRELQVLVRALCCSIDQFGPNLVEHI
ncbi:hypothetical protein CW362_40895 [Streptomyces populi]|uniref:Uncharacterized protein n=1 Tax=Streptomyces populi TaxID=2058924 RepID=A0A2I0SBN9_9ACTN|nr:hypothetical protein CW362_40895 [Streptomyces populi]